MTRETKIGLLVGLAFIIVIGILLSDHLTSSNEPAQATLAVAGNNVRSAVTTPGTGNGGPVTSTPAPAGVSPRQTVPTQTDLAPRPQPVQPVQVAVGGPSSLSAPTTIKPVMAQPVMAQPVMAQPVMPEAVGPTPTPASIEVQIPQSINNASRDPEHPFAKSNPVEVAMDQPAQTGGNTDVASALRESAKEHGEELVAVGGGTSPVTAVKPSNKGSKQYVATEGDSLSKIAAKFLGANTKANREAILAANPTMKGDPNKVIVGRTYIIPSSPGAPASAGTSPTIPVIAPTPAITPTVASTDTWYTVKEGDSLWKIATEQCGSAASVAAIKELNKETLKGDTVVMGTKLRLPNKVASAN